METLKNFYIISFNYKKLDLNSREEVLKKELENKIKKFYEEKLIDGFIILKTCLRIEIYLITDNFEKIREELLDNLNNYCPIMHCSLDALNHIFNLSCGLDSIIVGENQILSQVKKTYFEHLEKKTTTKELNVIFNNAISIGKKFRCESCINETGVSFEYLIIKYIKNIFPNLNDKNILLIGSGEIIKTLLYTLKKEKISNVILTNRTRHKLSEFKDDYNFKTINFQERYENLKKADIIISATTAPHYIIKHEDAGRYINDSKKRVFIDLAVPRDIEKKIIEYPNAYLYNIDDIYREESLNKKKREEISKNFIHLVSEQQSKCLEWFKKSKICRKKLTSGQEEAPLL